MKVLPEGLRQHLMLKPQDVIRSFVLLEAEEARTGIERVR